MITHLYNKTFESFIDEKTIDAAVKNLATQIFNDYHEKEPTFLSILKKAAPDLIIIRANQILKKDI